MSEKLVIPPADKLGPSEAAEFRRWLRECAEESISRIHGAEGRTSAASAPVARAGGLR